MTEVSIQIREKDGKFRGYFSYNYSGVRGQGLPVHLEDEDWSLELLRFETKTGMDPLFEADDRETAFRKAKEWARNLPEPLAGLPDFDIRLEEILN